MSWAVEEWKDGLPAKALQKILEIEGQLDKLKKERTQKQFQLDSLEAALQKQKQKVDSERSDASHLKRENQTLVESCDSLEKSRQKAVHDLGIKEQQVSYLDGQLSASKRTIERLEQELKKYKNESDRSSSSSSLSSSSCSELQSYATPLKSFPAPSATPVYRQQDNRLEELQGKYCQEVDERKRLETELKVLQVKMLNQSSTSISHKDIAARQQAGSSIFPWQKSDQPQSRQSQVSMETPRKRCGGGASSLWDAHDDTPIKPSQQISSSAVAQSPAGSSDQMNQLKALNQDLCGRMSELERNLASQEKEIRGQSSRLQELQLQLDQSRRELVDRDRDLAKTRHELTQASAKHQQSEDKCSSLEQKLKQVTEEMGCQRHNAESCKRALEQKLKDQERTSQKELAQLQSSQHALEQTLNQTKSKLTQEIQQAKKDHNMLEAEMEKVGHQKSQMQRDVEEHRQKLLRSEQGLQTSQSKEQDLRKKMEELLKEKNSVSVQLDQGSRRLSQLEEEKKSSEQSFKRTQGLLDDMKAKWEAQTEEVKGLKCKLEQQTQSSSKELDHLRKTLSDAEAKTNSSQSELQKQKRETEQLSDRLAVLEKEGQALSASLASSQQECTAQWTEHQALLAWKAEKEALIDQTEAVQSGLCEKISGLENTISQLNKDHDALKDQLSGFEGQRAGLSAQIDSLKGELLNKSTELEVRERQYEDAQAQLSEAGQKHAKDLDNMGVQVALLQEQVRALETQLQQEAGRADQAERSCSQLQDQHQTTCDLVLSKEQMLELGQAEISQLRDSLALASEQQDAQHSRLMEEKLAMRSQCEETVATKAEEAEQAKLELIKTQQDLMLSEEKISSLQSALKIQKSLGAGLQGQIDTLLAAEEEQKQALNATSEALKQTKQEVKTLQSQAEDKEKLLQDAEHKITALEEQTAVLETKAVDLKAEAEKLRHTHTEQSNGLQAQVTAMSEEMTRSKELVEQLPALKADLEAAKRSCVSLKDALEATEKSHTSSAENAAQLEKSLAEAAGLLGPLETQVRELSERRTRQEEDHVREMESFLHKQKGLKEQLEASREAERAATEELSARQEQVTNMKRSLSAASAGLAERDGAVKDLKEKLNRTEAEQTKASDSLKEKTVAMNKIKVQMEMLQMDLEDTETAMTSFDGQVEELKGTIALLESQKTDLVVRLEDSQAQVSVLETRLEEVQSSNATLESQYETAREELLERTGEVSRLGEEEAVRRIQMKEETVWLHQELAKFEAVSKIINKEKLFEDIGVLEATNEELVTSFDILENSNSLLVNVVRPLITAYQEALSSLERVNEEYGQLHVAYQQMVEETARLEAGLHELNEEWEMSNDECSEYASSNHSEEIDEAIDLEAELQQLLEEEAKLRQLTKETVEAKAKLQQVTKENIEMDAKLKQVTEEKVEAEAKLQQFSEEKVGAEAKLNEDKAQLQAELTNVSHEKHELETSLNRLAEEVLQLDNDVRLLTGDKIQLQASLDLLTKDKLQLCDSVRLLAEENQELKEKIESHDQINQETSNERCITSFDSQVEEPKGTISLLESQKTDLEVRLEESQAQVSVLETRLEEAQSSNATLESQYETAREELLERTGEVSRLVEEEAVRRIQMKEETVSFHQELAKFEAASIINNKEKEKLFEDIDVLEATNEELVENSNALLVNGVRPMITAYQEAYEAYVEAHSSLETINEEYGQLHVDYEQMVEETARLEADLHKLTQERELTDTYLRWAVQLENDKIQLQTSIDLLTEEKLQSQMDNIMNSMNSGQLMASGNEAYRQLGKEENHELKEKVESHDQINQETSNERQFESAQAELHEKMSGLQKELMLFKEQYAALLEKVDQQHRVLQQLSETPARPGSMDTASPCGGDQRLDGDTRPGESASCHPDEMEATWCGGDQVQQSSVPPAEEEMEPCASSSPALNMNQGEVLEEEAGEVSVHKPEIYAPSSASATDVEGPKKNLPEPHLLQAELDQSRDKMRLLEQELQSLRSEVLLLTSDLSLRKELSSELQGKVDQLELKLQASEVQGTGTARKLALTLQESRGFEKQVFQLSEERDALMLQMQTAREQLSDVMQMTEGMEMAKGDWDEKFLQQESELRRVRSEKANLEQHILGMESELETLQEQRGTLERDLESQRKACSGLQLQNDTLRTESTQLRSELVSCTEERDEGSRSAARWREEVHCLEKTNAETRQLISILEEDIRVGRKEYEALQSNAEKLDGEKQQLRGQVGALEQELFVHRGQREELLGQLDRVSEDQSSACHNSESMASKIQSLEAELSRMTQSLESSLLEKGEIASRLNSTQDEVQNMRSGIEKLQVRIESDERKKKKMGELLKAAQRKSDSLQDRIDALEREKEGTEQSLEEAVIQAEIVKAEIEELEDERKKVEEQKSSLGERLSALAAELDHLRQEKEGMERELETKSRVIEELRAAKEELEKGMERAETGRREEQERQRSVVEGMEREARAERAEALEKWARERETLEASVSKLEEELRGLRGGLMEAEAERARREQESVSRDSEERDALRSTISSLEGEASALAEEKKRVSAKLSSLEEEKERLVCSLASLENGKEDANAALSLSQAEKTRLEEEKEALRSSLSSLEAERDRLTGEQQDLQATLSSLEAELETCKQSLSQATQQVSELSGQVGVLSKGRDSALSKMNLWMKTCKQLQQEKETLVQNSAGAGSRRTEACAGEDEVRLLAEQKRQQEAVTAELEATRKELQEVRQELEEVSASLEERSQEADESLDKYCSLMVRVHKLEEANETLTARLQHTAADPAPPTPAAPTPTKRRSRRVSRQQEVAPEINAENAALPPALAPVSPARALSLGKRLHVANREGAASARTPAKAQEALHNLAKRIKASAATPKPGGGQDEEFKPEGLPELVQRGFADIPMGEASPFIMRRTTVKRRSHRLSCRRGPAAAEDAATQSPLADSKVLGPLTLQSPTVAAVTPAGSPAGRAERRSLSLRKTPERRDKRQEALREQAQQGDNCQVQ